MTLAQAAFAAVRFGLGPRQGDLDNISADPEGWLRSQMNGTPLIPPALADLQSSQQRFAELLAAQQEDGDAVGELLRERGRDWHLADLSARTTASIETAKPFVERLVHFWSNHFTISTTKPAVIVGAVAYENEAIRPHVLGRFSAMLKAVVAHPAMLIYLDNAQSIGPDSRVGQRRGRGLNENLAREILELHTLGVDGGYGQPDVRALAEILTGWSIARADDQNAGGFMFRINIHQPGRKTLLGTQYPEDGINEGLAALEALADHPSTARHVATKLARHFIADEPPPNIVDHLAGIFLASGGDLLAISMAVVDLFKAIEQPFGKVKSPHDFVVSTLRVFDGAEHARQGVMSMRLIGQMPFAAPSPAGWPDRAEVWLGPDALMKRIDWAVAVGQRMPGFVNPVRIARETIWPFASSETRFQIEAAPSVADGIALLLASPEFQRR